MTPAERDAHDDALMAAAVLREGVWRIANACQATYDAGPEAYTHGALRQLHYMVAHELRDLLAQS